MSIDVQDRLYAMTWAVEKAREAAKTDDLVRLSVLPALQAERDRAQQEARK